MLKKGRKEERSQGGTAVNWGGGGDASSARGTTGYVAVHGSTLAAAHRVARCEYGVGLVCWARTWEGALEYKNKNTQREVREGLRGRARRGPHPRQGSKAVLGCSG